MCVGLGVTVGDGGAPSSQREGGKNMRDIHCFVLALRGENVCWEG